MTVTFQPVGLALRGREVEARLVLYQGKLCAVLSLLDPQVDAATGWFVEAAFGPLDEPFNPAFPDLEAAEAWVISRMA